MLCVILSTGWLFSSFPAKAVKKRSWKLITITVIFFCLVLACLRGISASINFFINAFECTKTEINISDVNENCMSHDRKNKLSIYIYFIPLPYGKIFPSIFFVCLFFFVFAFSLFPSCLLWHKLVYQVGFKALLKARYPVKMVAEIVLFLVN